MRNAHVLIKENKLESIPGQRDRLLCSISSSVRLVVFKGNYKLHCSCSSVLVPSNLLFALMLNMFLIGKFLILLNFMHSFVEKKIVNHHSLNLVKSTLQASGNYFNSTPHFFTNSIRK
ncbi:hypothetical protein NC653_008288 [Populus alba x Populus x berolinensis]|uniref:Uncharacterized protein n=1 Tax=Populus alba x Populus x berolinensis TaxID=444605 RepID=A0AAD6W9Y6_9ROSI|nr:hypothetical protein NC653_008288 [Populus alba x Populus x berolinensis]